MSPLFAVIGKPISHSLSPIIHQCFAQQTNCDLTYEKMTGDEHAFEVQVRDFFNAGGKGLNITLPFKLRAYNLAHKTSARCKQAGAANTLWTDQKQLWADNTDGIGLIRDLKRYISVEEKRILLIGAGGAARGIISPLLDTNPERLVIVNRTLHRAQALQQIFPRVQVADLEHLTGQFDLVINATSASLDNQAVILPPSCLLQTTLCYDLAYNRDKPTSFVDYAKSMGCNAQDGLGMLVEQAAEAFFIWNEIRPETDPVLHFLRQNQVGTKL